MSVVFGVIVSLFLGLTGATVHAVKGQQEKGVAEASQTQKSLNQDNLRPCIAAAGSPGGDACANYADAR